LSKSGVNIVLAGSLARVALCVLPILVSILVSIGCVTVRTAQPLYDRTRDVTYDQRLIGTWSGEKLGTLSFSRGPAWRYNVQFIGDPTDNATTQPPPEVGAHLVAIGHYRYLFLDFPPESMGGDSAAGAGGTFLLPAYRLVRRGDRLELSALDGVALLQRLGVESSRADNTIQIDDVSRLSGGRRAVTTAPTTNAIPLAGEVVINDSPARIRRFLAQHENDPQLFKSLDTLRRATR
jgi:hypothetical protein